MRSLEDKEHSGWPLEVDNNQLRGSSKLILLQLHEKLPKNSTSTILWSFSIWSKLERWKKFISVCFMSWLKKKIIILKCHLLLFYAATTNQFLMGNKKWIFTTTGNDQLSRVGPRSSSKALPNAKFAAKKDRDHSLVICCLSDPLQLSESQQNHYIWEVCSASMRCTKNCNACSWHWSTERAWFFSMTVPDSTSHNQRNWTNWAMKFCLICDIHHIGQYGWWT